MEHQAADAVATQRQAVKEQPLSRSHEVPEACRGEADWGGLLADAPAAGGQSGMQVSSVGVGGGSGRGADRAGELVAR